ncbi:MAG: hypothetical protein RW306_03265 [Geobacteraceae bacterium]|nr:hypothetical protein [Geobacteraceae bacterium]
MNLHGIKKIGVLCLLVSMVPGMVLADNDFRRPPRERRRPPQAAFDICKDRNEGDMVEFITPNGTIKGTCKLFEGQLVAVPEGAPPPPGEEKDAGK